MRGFFANFMNLESKITDLLNELNKEEKTEFGISCIERTIDLFKYFDKDDSIGYANKSIQKANGFKLLKTRFDIIKNELYLFEEEKVNLIKRQISDLNPEPDLDNISAEAYITAMIIQSIIYVLNFHTNIDVKCIFSITKKNKEIINQIKSDEYLRIINPDAPDVTYEFLEPFFIRETEIEEKIIRMIKNKEDKNLLNNFISNNKIEWIRK